MNIIISTIIAITVSHPTLIRHSPTYLPHPPKECFSRSAENAKFRKRQCIEEFMGSNVAGKAAMERSCHTQARKKNDRDAEFCTAACGLVRAYGGKCKDR